MSALERAIAATGMGAEIGEEIARAVLMAVRGLAWDLHLTGEAAIADGREADGVFIAMIDAILNEEPK